jgi:PAS domain S-box-containing protein
VSGPLNVLIAEDSEADTLLLLHTLTQAGYQVSHTRVWGAESFEQALDERMWDVILCDHNMPSFDSFRALEILKHKQQDIPFIVVSGTIGEETAVRAMKAGAHDYLMKGHLARLAPAIAREIEEAKVRRELTTAQQSLLTAADQWQATFHSMAEAISVLDANGAIVRCNDAMVTLIGQPAEALVGHPCCANVHGTPGRIENCPFKRMTKTHCRESFEVNADGAWLSVTVDPILDEAGERLLGAVHSVLDITTRKNAEEKLRFNQFAMDHARDSVYWMRSDARFIYVNRAACEQLGYTSEELLGMTVHDIDHGFPKETWSKHWDAVKQKGSLLIETEHTTKDGRVIPVEIALSFHVFEGQEYSYATARDISARMAATQSLKESMARLELATAATNIGHWSWDLRTNEVFFSEQWKAQIGYEDHEISNTLDEWETRLHPEDRERTLNAVKDYNEGRVPEFDVEFRFRHKDGSYRWIYTRGVHQLDGKGEPISIIGCHVDITDRKRREEEIKWLARFPGENASPVLRVNRHGRVLYANSSSQPLLGMWGISEEDKPLLPPEWRERITRALDSGQTEQFEVEYDQRVNALALTPVRDSEYVNIYGMDITERKHAEKERILLEKQLRQSQKLESIGTLAGGVAHEINNPVMGIMNYAQLILDRLGPEHEVAEFATEIGKESERVCTIVKNLLAFARPETQTHSPARICDIVGDALSLIRTLIRHDQISLEVDVPEELPHLDCRSQQIQQVFMNLLTNARDTLNEKYEGFDDNKTIIITARPLDKEGEPWVRTTIEDHGCGIPAEVRERMFDPFYTTKPRDKGTGLGLSISHGLVKDHHGEISVESQPGEYTRVYLDLPVNDSSGLDAHLTES